MIIYSTMIFHKLIFIAFSLLKYVNRSVLFLSHSVFFLPPSFTMFLRIHCIVLNILIKLIYIYHFYTPSCMFCCDMSTGLTLEKFQRHSISHFIIRCLLILYLVFSVPVSKAILMSKQIMFVASPLSTLIVTSSNKLIAFDKHGFPFINVLVVFEQPAPVQVFSHFVPNQ